MSVTRIKIHDFENRRTNICKTNNHPIYSYLKQYRVESHKIRHDNFFKTHFLVHRPFSEISKFWKKTKELPVEGEEEERKKRKKIKEENHLVVLKKTKNKKKKQEITKGEKKKRTKR